MNTVTNDNGIEIEVPSDFICPITMEIMVHPLVNRRGVSFERSAILEWLQNGNGECPLTRIPMSVSDLIRNRPLEANIQFWRKKNGISAPSDELDEDDVPLFGYISVPDKSLEALMRRQCKKSWPANLRSRGLMATTAPTSMSRNIHRPSNGLVGRPTPRPDATVDDLPSIDFLEARRRERERRQRFLAHVMEMAHKEINSALQI